MNDRFQKQMQFIYEIDKVKSIIRKTKLFDGSRFENDAEHSWHLAMMALVLSEHSNVAININKVIKMVLIHDIVEVDGGDFIVYDNNASEQKEEREKECAERIYGMLPQDIKDDFIETWCEFEDRKTPEAKFAAAIDRAEPIIQNYFNQGFSWQEHDIPIERVIEVNGYKIEEGSKLFWDYIKSLLDECVEKGYLKTES